MTLHFFHGNVLYSLYYMTELSCLAKLVLLLPVCKQMLETLNYLELELCSPVWPQALMDFNPFLNFI